MAREHVPELGAVALAFEGMGRSLPLPSIASIDPIERARAEGVRMPEADWALFRAAVGHDDAAAARAVADLAEADPWVLAAGIADGVARGEQAFEAGLRSAALALDGRLAKAPRDARLLERRAVASTLLGRHAEARLDLEAVRSIAGASPSGLLLESLVESLRGDALRSAALLWRAEELGASPPSLIADVGRAFPRGRIELVARVLASDASAAHELGQLAAADPDRFGGCWLDLARLHLGQGEFLEARACLDRQLAREPRDPVGRLEKARLEAWAGNPDAAREIVRALSEAKECDLSRLALDPRLGAIAREISAGER